MWLLLIIGAFFISILCDDSAVLNVLFTIGILLYYLIHEQQDESKEESSNPHHENLVNKDTTSLSPQEITSEPPLRLPITQTIPKNKMDSEEIKAELSKQRIKCFYHFTDERNLESIRNYGGLISWYSCSRHNIDIPSAGGDMDSHRLDVRYQLHDYVRLSFCDDHPMSYRLKTEGKRIVLLKIQTDVALWKDTLFSDINAADKNHSHGGSLTDLQKVNFTAVKRNFVRRDDADFKYHQAEVLVKTAIPKELILNLDNPIYL